MSASHTPLQAGESREALLARVRAALATHPGAQPPEAPVIEDSIARLCAAEGDALTAHFEKAATDAGMVVLRASEESWLSVIDELLSDRDANRVACCIEDESLRNTLNHRLRETGRAVFDFSETPQSDGLFEVEVGITDVQSAIAETGSIVMASSADRSRCAHVIPPVHVAIVRAAQILPDMIDYWRAFPLGGGENQSTSSAIVLVTGPSKTADIEGILITGVHGPGEVHVVLIDN